MRPPRSSVAHTEPEGKSQISQRGCWACPCAFPHIQFTPLEPAAHSSRLLISLTLDFDIAYAI
ncbi:hypothetical protein [Porphyromonas asaccharolytica]|uniref:hypothetical protein n=1 Tax=Porphyromonas asaccharolytica TaxID=28123 RepID=UPI001112B75C|nr:hypothetical protein [Porphyromonas asaccharolytica]